VSDELDQVRRYVNAIEPPDARTVAAAKDRFSFPPAASGDTATDSGRIRRVSGYRWVAAACIVVAVVAALLVPSLGHGTPSRRGAAQLQDHLARLVVDDVNVTVAAGSYDMTFSDTTTPPTQCPQTPGSTGEVGGSTQKSTATLGGSCTTGNGLSPSVSTDGTLSSISGHGTVNLDPYGMVTVSDVGPYGEITLYDNGTNVWEIGGGNYGLSAPGQAGPGAPLSGYASSVEGTVGQVQGALDMEGLASGTGYLSLQAREIQEAQPGGTGSVDGVPVTIYKLSESGLLDPGVPGLTEEQVTTIRAADAIIEASGFAGKTTWVSVDDAGYVREQKTQYTLPDGSMVTEDTILSNYGCAGTVLMPGQSGTSTPPAGCVSPDTAGSSSSATTPSTTSSTQPSTPTTVPTSVTTAPSDICLSGSVSEPVQTSRGELCVHVGTTVTVTFDDSHAGIGTVGGWLGPARVDNGSVASLTGSSADGDQLVATLKAVSAGTATVSAYFSQQCASGNSTPCTIPAQGVLRLTITVVS
jgi:hypothetical protein